MGAWRNRRTDRGSVAIEFALVMMPLLVLLFGAVQYGLYFWAMQGGSDIARSAARMAAVDDISTATCTEFRDDVRTQIQDLTGNGATATITRTYLDTATPAGVSVGDKVRISVQFKSVDLHFPFVPFINDGMVTATGTSRVDYVRSPDAPPASCP